ncbi:MAG: hypothetical protein H6648_05320 [Caldilineae bacterium]|nr:hypothetical protein [Chloroflexota bacterium]MCB9176562.1 hypothetical protein [Caldilineae bacterium]
MSQPPDGARVSIAESIGLIPHPSDSSRPPIEPYVSDVFADLLAKYDGLGVVLAVFDSDSGISDHPVPPSIHVYADEETGVTGLPQSPSPVSSLRDAEDWLMGYWQHPRQDFNMSKLAPQQVLMIDERPFLVVTGQLGKTELGRLIHNERWTADIGGIDEASLEFQVVAAVARNYR